MKKILIPAFLLVTAAIFAQGNEAKATKTTPSVTTADQPATGRTYAKTAPQGRVKGPVPGTTSITNRNALTPAASKTQMGSPASNTPAVANPDEKK